MIDWDNFDGNPALAALCGAMFGTAFAMILISIGWLIVSFWR